jgi:RNA polymerase sigma factor (sigma-70 family)
MTVNYSRQRTIGDALETMYGLKLPEENLKNLLLHFSIRLRQYGLLGIYESEEVLYEVGSRFWDTLQKGKNVPIPNPEAWARITGRNIIHELSRKQKKYQTVEPNKLELVVATDEEISLTLEKQEESDRIHDALKQLKSETQELLKLRFFQGLSWQEIAEHLAQNGQNVSVATLRKRGERAINQLREVYFEKFL